MFREILVPDWVCFVTLDCHVLRALYIVETLANLCGFQVSFLHRHENSHSMTVIQRNRKFGK